MGGAVMGVGFLELSLVVIVCSLFTSSTFLEHLYVLLRLMLVGVWLGLLWVLFYFFDHYIQSSASTQRHVQTSHLMPVCLAVSQRQRIAATTQGPTQVSRTSTGPKNQPKKKKVDTTACHAIPSMVT